MAAAPGRAVAAAATVMVVATMGEEMAVAVQLRGRAKLPAMVMAITAQFGGALGGHGRMGRWLRQHGRSADL